MSYVGTFGGIIGWLQTDQTTERRREETTEGKFTFLPIFSYNHLLFVLKLIFVLWICLVSLVNNKWPAYVYFITPFCLTEEILVLFVRKSHKFKAALITKIKFLLYP